MDNTLRHFRQLVWATTEHYERKVASITPVNTLRGTRREISTLYSDVDPADVFHTPIYDPKNWRHTDRELARYIGASMRDFQSTKIVHLAGPDGTKVGTDFGCTMGAFMNPVTKRVCVALPQVSSDFIFV